MSKLPEPGMVYAVAVRRTLELHFRVVAAVGDTRCVVLSRWSGPPLRAPRADAALFEVQPLDHHDWARPMLGGWVNEPPPPNFRLVGSLPLREGEAERVLHPQVWVKLPKKTAALALKVLPLCKWDTLWTDAQAQWRWDHERDAVEQEDEAREAEKARSLEAALATSRDREMALRAKGLPGLKRHRFFKVWQGEKPKALITAAEGAMREAVEALEGKSPKQAARRLAALVKTFNALHAEYDFDSADAEDVMEAVVLLAEVCDVDADVFEQVVDGVRAF